jgi:hypothetical protein
MFRFPCVRLVVPACATGLPGTRGGRDREIDISPIPGEYVPVRRRQQRRVAQERIPMKFVEWSMQGVEFSNCNCAYGCPCQFNALPTHGNCRAFTFVQIERGRFGGVVLDGLRWGILAAWPGAIHLGNGTFQTVVEERATGEQRAAIEAVSHGRETEPGTLIWQVFSTTVTKVLPTLFRPIELSVDRASRTASLKVPGVIEGKGEPIRNPKTGAEHRASLRLPKGFEFTDADFISGKAASEGPIELKFDGTHAHLADIHWSTHGVVR